MSEGGTTATQGVPPADRPGFAIGIRLFAMFCLTVMSAIAKLLDQRHVHLAELMFYRQLFALPIIIATIAAVAGLGSVRTRRLGAHVSRMALGLIAMSLTFGAVLLLPLAEATTIGFTVPIFATILATLMLRERAGIHRWGAVLVGFVGVLVVIQPGGNAIPLLGVLVGLASASLIAFVSVLLRQLGQTETALTIVFWFSILSLVPLGAILPFVGGNHDMTTWSLLFALGTIGGIGQLALTSSLRLAPVTVVVPFDYSSLLWATLLGWTLFGVLPVDSTWLGAPLIIASGLYIVWRERRRRQENVEVATSLD